MRTALLVTAALALLAAPASARELPATTPDAGVAAFDRDVDLIATNGSRTFVSGLFRYVGTRGGDGAVVSARSGAARTVVPGLGWGSAVISDRAGGWYVGNDAGAVRHVGTDGSSTLVAAPSSDPVESLALSGDGRTLWVGGFGLWKVDAATGATVSWGTRRTVDLALSTDGATLYAASWNPSVVAYDAASGAVKASGPAGQGVAIVVTAGGVYAVQYNGWLSSLDPATLAERWRAPGTTVTRDMAASADGGTLFVTRSGAVEGVVAYRRGGRLAGGVAQPGHRRGCDRPLGRRRGRLPRARRRAGLAAGGRARRLDPRRRAARLGAGRGR